MQPEHDLRLRMLAELRRILARDRAAGGLRSLAVYRELFPDLGDEVGEELSRLDQTAVDGSANPGASPGDAGPRRFGHFDIIRLLGEGAQGSVYLACDLQLGGRKVALKLLSNRAMSTDRHRMRFQREAEIASRLDHPGLATVYEFGYQDETPFIAMRYVEGETLQERLNRLRSDSESETTSMFVESDELESDATVGPAQSSVWSLSSPSTRQEIMKMVAIVERCARALHFAHEVHLVHRDVKPGNILLDTSDRPVVVDFGLARNDESDDVSMTRPGDLLGTVPYMAPEQLSPFVGPPDRRVDVYALGVTLFECLTLQRPFHAPTRPLFFQAILTEPTPDPRRLNASIPRDLKVVIETALEKNRDRRYQTAGDLADDLKRVREYQPIRARPTPLWLRAGRWVRRRRAMAAILGIFVPALLAVGLLAARQQIAARAEEQRARDIHLGWSLVARLSPRPALLPQDVPLYRAWLGDARELMGRKGHYAAALTEWAPDGLRHRQATTLLAHLDRIRGEIPRMARDYAVAASVQRQSVDEASEGWRESLDDLASSPAFAGWQAEPIAGLAPWRKNPKTGWWEFWLPNTGRRPSVDRRSTDDAIVVILLPGGTFEMGTRPAFGDDEDELTNEHAHPVTLGPCLLSRDETTRAQWIRVMGDDPSYQRSSVTYQSDGESVTEVVTPLHPVENVAWDDVAEFVRRIGAEIPTEAVWEYACRAGSKTRFSCGDLVDDLEDFENVNDEAHQFYLDSLGRRGRRLHAPLFDGFALTAPVGSLDPNEWGFCDLHGNVREWCRDGYAPRHEPRPDSRDGLCATDEVRSSVVRGGSYFFGPELAYSAHRSLLPRRGLAHDLGFRVAVPVPWERR